MAGNTKLIGIMPGGEIRLERWGTYENVRIGQEAAEAIAKACKEALPLEPPERELREDFLASFDRTLGYIRVTLHPGSAIELATILSGSEDPNHKRWLKILDEAIDASGDHDDCREPGIE
jgi:hypothetical protein